MFSIPKLKPAIITLFLGALLVLPCFAFAQSDTITLQIPPNSDPTSSTIKLCEKNSAGGFDCNGIVTYVQTLYIWLLGAVGIVAVASIMFAGAQWTVSRGDSGAVGKAKEMMQNSLAGLALTLGAYLLLWAINPDFVVLKPITLGEQKKVDLNIGLMQQVAKEETSLSASGVYTAPGEPTSGFTNLRFSGNAKIDVEKSGNITDGLRSLLKDMDTAGFKVTISTLKTGHNQYSSSGNVSNHWVGKGADITGDNAELIRLAKWLAAEKISQLNESFYCYPDAPMTKKGTVYPTVATLTEWGLCSSHKDHLHLGLN